MTAPKKERTLEAELRKPWKWLAILLGLACLALGLAWVSNGFNRLSGASSFLWLLLISAGILALGWRLMSSEKPPRWLLFLMVGAAVLRLAAGTFWFVALPVWGHGTPAERAGYVMGDAASRDQAAWKLASSNRPLWAAFQDNRKVDQYGGLLFLSALVYRYLGSQAHQPLLLVVLAAACSALVVLLGWALARQVWGATVAAITAWGLCLYPEAVLLGSSQMREAFTIPLAAAAFYGLLRYNRDRSRTSLAWIFIPFLLAFFFSTLTAVLLVGSLGLVALVVVKPFSSKQLHNRWFWLILILLVILALAGLWLALREVTPERITNPIAMLSWWLHKSARLQAYISEHASGWMQKIFDEAPQWLHLPFLLAYGVVQPFLPAALVAGSEALIWRWIAVWRALGWTALLAFLAFAPVFALRQRSKRALVGIITLVIWLIILVAAFRGGSDMWDNPRYRAILASLQIALASAIWVEESQSRDPWLRRALLATGAVLVWFLPWYLQRYYSIGWPVTDPFRTLGLGLATASLLILADWARWGRPDGSVPTAPPGRLEDNLHE